MSKYFQDKYDVIVIGGALAGMSAAIDLARNGKKVLILERHNLPGGIATSFVRNGQEMEGALHEMMSIGSEEDPLKLRSFFDEVGIDIDWKKVPEAYRICVPEENIDITLHAGRDKNGHWVCADEIEAQYPNTKEKVDELLNFCLKVCRSVDNLDLENMSKSELLKQHKELVMTCGYSAKEVISKFELPKEVVDILSAYYIYVGSPIDDLPFTIYAYLMGDYMYGGSYVARGFSHEMSVAMAEKCFDLGVQIEYGIEVEKVLVKNGHTYGIRTKGGTEVFSDYIISGVYPNTMYHKMIEPKSEVKKEAFKYVNSRKMSVSCFSLVIQLDQTPEQLGIKDYSVFSGKGIFDSKKYFDEGYQLGNWSYLTTICLNLANPDGVKKGCTSLNITALPMSDCFYDVKPDDYYETKCKIAKQMLDDVSNRLGVNLIDHIINIEIETPVTISHFTNDYLGGIYGYQHYMDDSVVARTNDLNKQDYIKGLAFACAASASGDGMAVACSNGRTAAKRTLKLMEEEQR